MKKLSLKSKILLGAILMGGTVAGAHTISNIPSAQEARYDWDGEGPDHSGTLSNATILEAQDAYGCEGTEDPCAEGELVSGTGSEFATISFD